METKQSIDPTAILQAIEERAAASLWSYLGFVRIDARPKQVAWQNIIEPWQIDRLRYVVPALEYVAGVSDELPQHRNFWFEEPRGHDKTGRIGRLCNWLLAFSQRRLRIAAAASTRDQARLLAKSMDDELRLNPWLAKRIGSYRNELRGPGGSLEILSSDAYTASGRKDDVVILDELTFWENRELYDVLRSGVSKRPSSVFVVITNAGVRHTWQWELREIIRESADWFFFQSPPRKMLASWMTPEVIEEIRQTIRPGFARRVLDNEWIDATETPLIPMDDIIAAESHEARTQGSKRGDLYLGGDFGRAAGKTAIAIIERVNGVVYLRQLEVWSDMPFAQQEAKIREILKDKNIKRAWLDKGSQGWTTVENLERDFPGRVTGQHLNTLNMGEWAVNLAALFRDRKIRIPPGDIDMRQDLQQVEEVQTANGKPRVRSEQTSVGHADRFWALALAVAALPRVQVSRTMARAHVTRIK